MAHPAPRLVPGAARGDVLDRLSWTSSAERACCCTHIHTPPALAVDSRVRGPASVRALIQRDTPHPTRDRATRLNPMIVNGDGEAKCA